jgi:hypothetical protein
MQKIRKAGPVARISVPAALAAGLAAPLLAMALAAPASAATGPRMGSAGQTGFVVTGAQIRDVRGQVFGRNGGGFASTQAGIGGSLSLWAGGNRGMVILVGISTGTGSPHEPWSPGINVYQNHKLIASQNDASVNGKTCTAAGTCTPGDSANWTDQQQFRLELFYNRTTGNVEFQAKNANGDSYSGFYSVGTGKSFSQARVTADFGNTPFDSAGYTAAPPAAKLYLTWSRVGLTSYSGHRAGLVSWWTRSHLDLVDAAGGAVAGSLFNGGTAFRTVLTP